MTRFRERLVPGPGTVLAVLLLLPAVTLVALPVSASPLVPIGLAVVVTGAAEALLFGLAPVVSVADGELRAGPAHIAVTATGTTESFRGSDAVTARGVGLDARAWTLLRGWIDPVVRIRVEDPDDPTPYWVVSTRRPEELRAALAAARSDRRA